MQRTSHRPCATSAAGAPARTAPTRLQALTPAGLVVFVLLALSQVPSAEAATSGGTTNNQTVTGPAVRSITVSPAAVTCTPALTIPGGQCTTGPITITNGPAAAHVLFNGANDIPTDNGTPWKLCGGAIATPCSGNSGVPGLDEFSEVAASGPFNPLLDKSPAPDPSFGSVAAAGQTVAETLTVFGPSASTDTSTSFSTVVTWTAAP